MNRLDLTFKWKTDGDLLLDNSVTYLGSLGPYAIFDVFFALKMGWLVRKENEYELGPNLKFAILKHTDGTDRQSTDLDAIWIGAGLGKRFLTSYWGIFKSTQLYLSIAASWTFLLHSNDNPHQSSSMVQVYSDIVKSNIVNDKLLGLLAETSYKKEDNGIVHIQPTNIRYIGILNNTIDYIAIYFQGQSGQPIHLTGGKSTITLHFTREARKLQESQRKYIRLMERDVAI